MVLSDDGKRIDGQRWLGFAAAKSNDYREAEPFPHIVIDDFLPENLAQAMVDEFPPLASMTVKNATSTSRNKGQSRHEEDWGPKTLDIVRSLNSRPFLEGISVLTGIDDLLNDPYLDGGGLHQIGDGGFLKIHADFNRHMKTGIDRRINLLFYLNKDWPAAFGGQLELWDHTMSRCIRRVEPTFNRCVIFSTTSWSYHGHPDPLRCDQGITRKSLALYYYTNGRPRHERKANHSTLYKSRPGEKVAGTGMRSAVRAGIRKIFGIGRPTK